MVRVLPRELQAAWTSIVRAGRSKPPALEAVCEPIVLMHGIAGFREIDAHGVHLVEYFRGVRDLLGEMGYRVFAPEVAPFDEPHDRANQWLHKIEAILKQTGAEKVHLVGHSQGGLDARVIVAPAGPAVDTSLGPIQGLGQGSKVASLTTISTPHFGSAIADKFKHDSPAVQKGVEAFCDFVEMMARPWRPEQQDLDRAVESLSHEYVTKYFNKIIKDDPQVPCFAVGGDPLAKSVVHRILRPTYLALNELDPSQGGGPNDSLVTVASAFFGNLPPGYTHLETELVRMQRRPHWNRIGLIQADHIAEVGLELRAWPSNAYNHRAFFAGLAQRLDASYTADMNLLKDGRWERTTNGAATAGVNIPQRSVADVH